MPWQEVRGATLRLQRAKADQLVAIVRMRDEGKTHAEIAKAACVSRGRVTQILRGYPRGSRPVPPEKRPGLWSA